ncbi:MAG: LEPR-XLL domain-containing protein, partial [Gammaproteobacteria bacterium]|nr:LEPR-XLL domain-containing protein [Gammaproteobacteria bacterium]
MKKKFHRTFELDALETRILLSADPLLAGVADPHEEDTLQVWTEAASIINLPVGARYQVADSIPADSDHPV